MVIMYILQSNITIKYNYIMKLSALYREFERLEQYIKSLGITKEIKNKDLCITAFLHKSFSADYNNSLPHNERLEFLGDAILGATIAKHLYLDHPEWAESKMSLYKIALVREDILATVAREINLWKQLFVSKGEEKNNGRNKNSILSDALESLIGYFFLDMGSNTAEDFILRYIYSHIDHISHSSTKSYKTKLQEIIQKQFKIIPEYKETLHSQENNNQIYKSEIYVFDVKKSEWFGTSKKKAQEAAAEKLYKEMKA